MKEIPQHVSESVKRLNPHLYSNGRVLGGLETQKPKPTSSPTLARLPRKLEGGKKGVECVVTLCCHRKRLLDSHDNLRSSIKPLVDAIAKSLLMDDADPRIAWQYHQLKTEGREGVVVTIERLC